MSLILSLRSRRESFGVHANHLRLLMFLARTLDCDGLYLLDRAG
jgi:hypothetical protein